MRELGSWNKACILKLSWIFFFRHQSIWANWYIKKVLAEDINNYWVINTKKKHSQSWLANKLLQYRDLVFTWIKVKVGNGRTIRFWIDNWSPFDRLKEFLGSNTFFSCGIRQKPLVSWLVVSSSSKIRTTCECSSISLYYPTF